MINTAPPILQDKATSSPPVTPCSIKETGIQDPIGWCFRDLVCYHVGPQVILSYSWPLCLISQFFSLSSASRSELGLGNGGRNEAGLGKSLVKMLHFLKRGLSVILQPRCGLEGTIVFSWLCYCPCLCLLGTLWSDYQWDGFSLSQGKEIT